MERLLVPQSRLIAENLDYMPDTPPLLRALQNSALFMYHYEEGSSMNVLFVAGFGPVITDIDSARGLYVDTLGLPLKEEDNHYFHSEKVDGVKHFACWPLSQAAESCFATPQWPKDVPAPTSWLEFDVDDVAAASRELEGKGYKLLVSNRTEPWKQVVTRFLSPEGVLVGITYTPSMREK